MSLDDLMENYGTFSSSGQAVTDTAEFNVANSYRSHGPRYSDGNEPEKNLMQAVLEDAIKTYQKYYGSGGRREARLFREAEEWIFSYNVKWPFSFENICNVLGYNPDYLRLGLKRWNDAQNKVKK